MPAFDSIVGLCRLSRTCQIAGANLIVRTESSAEVSALIDAIEAGGRRVATVFEGKERPSGLRALNMDLRLNL